MKYRSTWLCWWNIVTETSVGKKLVKNRQKGNCCPKRWVFLPYWFWDQGTRVRISPMVVYDPTKTIRIISTIQRFLAKFRPFFDEKLLVEFSDIQRSMTLFNISSTFYDTFLFFCVHWTFIFGGYIKVLWNFSTFSREFLGLPGIERTKLWEFFKKKFWKCSNLPTELQLILLISVKVS